MKPRTEKSMELYHIMLKRGYPEKFCDQVTKNLYSRPKTFAKFNV